jgi:hypothetical protein
MLIALIVTCEVAFWVLLGAGLALRYLLRWRRASNALLLGVPLVDVVLLIATVVDVRRGAEVSFAHGLAAVYLGFSVAFGHSMVRWADQRFAYHFAGGPPPWKPPKGGRARVAYEWRSFGQAMIGWAVSCALLGLCWLLVGDPERARPLLDWVGRLSVVMGFWLVFGPLLETVLSGRTGRDRERSA